MFGKPQVVTSSDFGAFLRSYTTPLKTSRIKAEAEAEAEAEGVYHGEKERRWGVEFRNDCRGGNNYREGIRIEREG